MVIHRPLVHMRRCMRCFFALTVFPRRIVDSDARRKCLLHKPPVARARSGAKLRSGERSVERGKREESDKRYNRVLIVNVDPEEGG